MFTTPAPPAPTLSTTTQPASPSSPTRSGRLRGLSYLRNYTHQHLNLHSGERSPTASGHARHPSLSRTQSTPSPQSSPRRANTQETVPPPPPQTETSRANTATAPTNGWVPTVGGRSGLSRVAPSATPATPATSSPRPAPMTRNRAESAAPSLGAASTYSQTDGLIEVGSPPKSQQLPSIRFIPHEDPRSARPSLQFPPISRTLPNEDCVIRVGRYSERDNIPDIPANIPSSAAVGFKSKVVSRRHCEFWCTDGQWWIKDVKSSSGTFLNHIRLSQPGVESKPYKVGDGDVVQLGIDFRGGEEMIFRCVKIRIECNRNWQKRLNNFNKSTHKRLRNLAQGSSASKSKDDASSTQSTECSICLGSIRPCQALFVAPCSHVWHFKCIRQVINGPTFPQFLCPNCRMVNDLDAEVSEPEDDDWDDDAIDESLEDAIAESKLLGAKVPIETLREDEGEGAKTPRPNSETSTGPSIERAQAGLEAIRNGEVSEHDLAIALGRVDLTGNISDPLHADGGPSSDPDEAATSDPHTPPAESSSEGEDPSADTTSPSSSVAPLPIIAPGPPLMSSPFGESTMLAATPAEGIRCALTPESVVVGGAECPMTPRNDAGPFVLDGSAGREAASGAVRRGDVDVVESLDRNVNEVASPS